MYRIILFLVLISSNAKAQFGTLSGGGMAQSISGSVSYSIGQVFYLSMHDSSGIASQGNQQCYELFTLYSDEKNMQNLQLKVYPNPVSNILILQNNSPHRVNLKLLLYDGKGVLIKAQNTDLFSTDIVMSNLANAIYFLQVYSNNKMLQSYKIIKNE